MAWHYAFINIIISKSFSSSYKPVLLSVSFSFTFPVIHLFFCSCRKHLSFNNTKKLLLITLLVLWEKGGKCQVKAEPNTLANVLISVKVIYFLKDWHSYSTFIHESSVGLVYINVSLINDHPLNIIHKSPMLVFVRILTYFPPPTITDT